ncbi:MAG: ribose-phosphate diphosphokinase, partial [Acidilobaceae archaeon]
SPPRQDVCLIESLLASEAFYSSGAEEVVLYIPYLPYARQDKQFLKGEAVSSRAVLKAIYSVGVKKLVSIEVHSELLKEHFPGELLNVHPLPHMAEVAGVKSSSVVVAPDAGGLKRASSVASATGAQLVQLSKTRDRITGEVRIEAHFSLDLSGKEVFIVDDMVSTGSTIAEASRTLLSKGAKRVNILVAHFLNLPGSIELLRRAGVSKVIASNTVAPVQNDLVSYLDISELVAETLKRCLFQ